MKHTVTGRARSRLGEASSDDLCVRRKPCDRQGRGAVDHHPLPQPGHRRVARLHGHAAGPQHLQGRDPCRIRAGPDRICAAMEGRARRALRLLRHAHGADRAELARSEHRSVRAHRQPVERPCGLIWQPTNAQSYYALVEQRLQPVRRARRLRRVGTNLNPINQFLDPEETYNYEVGATWDFTPALRLRTAIFRVEKTNARYTDPLDTSSSCKASVASTAWSSSSRAASRRIGTSTRAWRT